ncbi:hypothetical protein GDO86_020611 [Hymenochirus boettgeri]|uniref:CRIB domain-containing protein n=1 Tax=Hymenochirus boettgeri TaxID=247094 RepID=A0A8T2IFG8_9PIPI|nr:hypothetical protein GDO86_020611 [Hymenochirus boettgeri]
MPPQWAQLLQNSNISVKEQKQNPQAVLDVLNFYSEGTTNSEKYMSFTDDTVDVYSSATPTVIQAKPVSEKEEKRTVPESEDAEEEPIVPPPLAPRPEYTKSKYTVSVIETFGPQTLVESQAENGTTATDKTVGTWKKGSRKPQDVPMRRFLEKKHREYIGDPKKKYTRFEKIGKG